MGSGGSVPLPPGDDSECTCGRRWPWSHLAVDPPATPIVEEHRYSMLGPFRNEIGSFQSDEGGDPLMQIGDLGATFLILRASPSESVAPVISVPPDAVGEDSASSSSAVKDANFSSSEHASSAVVSTEWEDIIVVSPVDN